MKSLLIITMLFIICGCGLTTAQEKNKKSNTTEIQKTMKAIRLLQERQKSIASSHDEIDSELKELKARLAVLTKNADISPELIEKRRQEIYKEMSHNNPLIYIATEKILAEAEARYPNKINIEDILSVDDLTVMQQKIDKYVEDFNNHYGLDSYDYAIAGLCGLIGGGLDFFFVSMPAKPSVTKIDTPLNGAFNRSTQKIFKTIFPPEKTAELSHRFKIGSADTSIAKDLIDTQGNVVAPNNHRLRSLSHDPILGVLVGMSDMKNNTLTVVENGGLVSYKSLKESSTTTSWRQLGLMFGHLASDVNAPSARGNRGMGLPVPFMGLLKMLGDSIPVDNSNLGRQIELMYMNGYDSRHFATMSFPVAIMEVLIRVLYSAKQSRLYGTDFFKTMADDTLPFKLNPRFRVMMSIAYGTFAAVNAGKFAINGNNPLTLNYPAWTGFVWNGIPALKWYILDKHLKLWNGIADQEIEEIKNLVIRLYLLEQRAAMLPAQ